MDKSTVLILGYGFLSATGVAGIGALLWNWFFRWLFVREKR
ncbi:hypothetical protein X747_14395 [Mesorhizobium sp. LNJC384A00]|nr:hypothetical protein [Mesorhizobium sp. LNJC384A00]ESX98719.1 hypothetical protein X755_15315 [Mesorhizobium sp. LNJC405B00]ESY41996.1 hypothetical protein X747_14395 [Mesorhizobium sp. LNJC384A00]